MRGFSLKFRMNEGVTRPEDRDEVRQLADHDLATRALHLGSDYLLVFDLTNQEYVLPRRIVAKYSSGLQLFKRLVRLATPVGDEQPTLREVNIFFERPTADPAANEAPPMHLLEWLSDGEQSFLGRMCLFSLLGTTETLVLLDEPEVHFNDYWKRQIVYFLDGVLEGRRSHALIATHSSIALTDVPRDDIIVLDRSANHTSQSFIPRIQTFATDPSDIMVHVFGTPQAVGAQSVARIERALSTSPARNPADRQQELEELLSIVGPGYWRYRIRRELPNLSHE